MDLKSKLNTAKNMASEPSLSERRVQRQNVQTFTGNLESLDREVFGELKTVYDTDGRPVYSADEEMKRIKQGLPKDLSNCKLPDVIKESIISNPLITTSVDPKMDSFTEALAKKIPGVQKVASIMNQLDETDRQKEETAKATLNENIQHTAVSVDYSLIKNIVENAVKSLKDELRNELNESVHRSMQNNSPIKAMVMTDKFLFLDSDDNIFECQMVYKGKNRKGKQ